MPYLSFADLDFTFSTISSMFGTNGFLEKILNKLFFFFFKGKYLDGFIFNSEYKLKNSLTILSSKE